MKQDGFYVKHNHINNYIDINNSSNDNDHRAKHHDSHNHVIYSNHNHLEKHIEP